MGCAWIFQARDAARAGRGVSQEVGYCLPSKRLHRALFRLPTPSGSSDSSVLIDGRGLAEFLHSVATAQGIRAQNRS